jgi:hypothetical protein
VSKIIEYLESFNRNDRFFLVGATLGKPTFELDSEFSGLLGEKFALNVPQDAFVAMDYHLDWIYASAYLNREGLDESARHRNEEGRVSGTQQDIDLIVVFETAETTQIIMLEAKAETAWSQKQADSKIDRLAKTIGPTSDAFSRVQPHFGLMSPRQPLKLKTAGWPS